MTSNQENNNTSPKVGMQGIYNTQETHNNKAASIAKDAALTSANTIEGASFNKVKGETGLRSSAPLNEKQQNEVTQIDNTLTQKANVLKELKSQASNQENTNTSPKVGMQGIYNTQETHNNKAASIAKDAALTSANTIEGASFNKVKGETGLRSSAPLNEKQQNEVTQIDNTLTQKANVLKELKSNNTKTTTKQENLKTNQDITQTQQPKQEKRPSSSVNVLQNKKVPEMVKAEKNFIKISEPTEVTKLGKNEIGISIQEEEKIIKEEPIKEEKPPIKLACYINGSKDPIVITCDDDKLRAVAEKIQQAEPGSKIKLEPEEMKSLLDKIKLTQKTQKIKESLQNSANATPPPLPTQPKSQSMAR